MSRSGSDTSSIDGVEGTGVKDLDAADGDVEDDAGFDDADDEDASRRSAARAGTMIRLVLAGVLVLIVAVVAVSFARSGPAAPSDNSVAAGLARDMTDHHAQAVDMATIIQFRTRDPAIRTLATDIALTQTNQMGQMQGWLNLWNLSIGRSGPAMAWMTQDGGMNMGSGSTMDPSMMRLRPDGLMPGMATQAQVNQLRTLPPAEADRLFLQLMIAHHRGGVAMARTALAETTEPVVVRLCRTIVTDQQLEIIQMTRMLQERA
jgi:uncharacterized protein (DUF305 family)